MRKAALDRQVVLSVIGASAACVACGASPAYDAKSPQTVALPANEVIVVPADRIVEKCPCDGDPAGDVSAPRRSSVEYVPMNEWQSPAAAKRAEAFVAEDPLRFRASTPAPVLTMHQGIPETRVYRVGRGWGWRY